MTWLHEAWAGLRLVGGATWDTVLLLVTSPTGWVFIAVWVLAYLGGYWAGRGDRDDARRKDEASASRPAHGRRAAR